MAIEEVLDREGTAGMLQISGFYVEKILTLLEEYLDRRFEFYEMIRRLELCQVNT